jgi:hypothetical protein
MMSKRNGHSRIHTNTLHPSSQDTIALCMAVQERFLNLCGTYLRVNGVELPVPQWLDKEFLNWRGMAVRHKKGDFRNNEAELKSLRVVAQWTLDMNCTLRNQPRKVMDWGE